MPGACGSERRTSRGIGQTRRRERVGSTGAASQSWSAPHVATPFVSSRRTSSCQTNAVASTWSALRRSAPTARPKYPESGTQAAARQIGQKAPGDIPRADHVERKHAGRQRAKERLLESSEVDDRRRGLLRETRGLIGQLAPGERPSTAARIMCSEMPVIRETAGGICSPSGSAIRHACACVTVLRDSGPADLKEMPSRRSGRGLAVDDQHLAVARAAPNDCLPPCAYDRTT